MTRDIKWFNKYIFDYHKQVPRTVANEPPRPYQTYACNKLARRYLGPKNSMYPRVPYTLIYLFIYFCTLISIYHFLVSQKATSPLFPAHPIQYRRLPDCHLGNLPRRCRPFRPTRCYGPGKIPNPLPNLLLPSRTQGLRLRASGAPSSGIGPPLAPPLALLPPPSCGVTRGCSSAALPVPSTGGATGPFLRQRLLSGAAPGSPRSTFPNGGATGPAGPSLAPPPALLQASPPTVARRAP
jgi:hypothetical protein